MNELEAVQLVAEARSRSVSGTDDLRTALAATDNAAVRAVLLRGLAEIARESPTGESLDQSIKWLNDSITAALEAARPDLVREAQLTLSGSLFINGEAIEAVQMLDLADHGADDHFRAKVDFQRATFLARQGQLASAIAAFDDALARFEVVGDRYFIASTYGNRGQAHLEQGAFARARSDLSRARRGYGALGIGEKSAFMEHNLGRLAGYSGDVIGALRHFRASETALMRMKADISEVQVNRCEVLLAAGLFNEAVSTAAEIEPRLNLLGRQLERAEAVLAWSLGLLGQGCHDEAIQRAGAAAALFSSQQRRPWVLRADVVAMLASVAGELPVDGRRAIRHAGELQQCGQWLWAWQAWAIVALDDPARALASISSIWGPHTRLPLEYRLIGLEVHARHRLSIGDAAGALVSTRRAITAARHVQWIRGSSDLRAGVSAQLERVLQLGLGLRRDRGDLWGVVRWVDRAREASTPAAHRRPQPDDDGELDALHAELRTVQRDIEHCHDASITTLLRHQADLQHKIILSHRLTGDPRRRTVSTLPRAVRELLDGVCVVQYHRHGRNLAAVVIEGSRPRLVDLGPIESFAPRRAHLQSALRRLTRGANPDDTSAVDALQRHARALGDLIVPPTRPSDTMVIIPLPGDASLPWALLETNHHRRLTVAPTLRHWLEAREVANGRVGLIEGPDLRGGKSEIDAIAQIWSGRPVTVVRNPTVAETIDLLSDCDVLHIACHGDRRTRDGRFAQLRLRDGSLTSLELERLPQAPQLVILAACDAGLLEPLPGDEASGLATALFAAGTDTIIAPVAPIPDSDLTARIFIELHQRLAAGDTPSEALNETQDLYTMGGSAGIVVRTINCLGCG